MTDTFMFIRVADTETTGHPPDAEMVEIGWTDLRYYPDGWQIEADQQWRFVDPGRPIPPAATTIHGITDAMVVGGLDPDEARRMIATGPTILCAHNAAFDRQFLRGHRLDWICTLECARHLWPGMRNHKNETLREELGISVPTAQGAHRAGYDSGVTARILLEILDHMSVEEAIELSRPDAVPIRMPFGKMKGARFSEIDADYLDWLIKEPGIRDGIKTAARREVERRSRL